MGISEVGSDAARSAGETVWVRVRHALSRGARWLEPLVYGLAGPLGLDGGSRYAAAAGFVSWLSPPRHAGIWMERNGGRYLLLVVWGAGLLDSALYGIYRLLLPVSVPRAAQLAPPVRHAEGVFFKKKSLVQQLLVLDLELELRKAIIFNRASTFLRPRVFTLRSCLFWKLFLW